MNVQIHLFAGLAETIGSRLLTLELPAPDMTIEQLKQLIAERYPDAAEAVRQAFAAVNHEYAAGDRLIRERDEIALIPPVSGG